MKQYQQYSNQALVSKLPFYLRHAGSIHLLLGAALFTSLATLAYTTTLLDQALKGFDRLDDRVEQLALSPTPMEKAEISSDAGFCAFPLKLGCQTSVMPIQEAEPKLASVATATPEITGFVADLSGTKATVVSPLRQNPLGWIYAGKHQAYKALKTEGEILAGRVYTMLKNLNVRRMPASTTASGNQRVLDIVMAGEKVRVLAVASSGEHQWLQVARP